MATKLSQLPILTVWYKPEETIRRVLDGKAYLGIETIFGIYAVVVAIRMIRGESMYSFDMGLQDPLLIVLVSILAALVFTSFEIYTVTVIVRWTGKFIGGVATWDEVKAVVAWNKLTFVILYILLLFIGFLFIPNVYRIDMRHVNLLDMLIILIVVSILGWRVLIYSRMITEVHQIKFWQGASLAFLPILLLGIFVVLFIIIVQ